MPVNADRVRVTNDLAKLYPGWAPSRTVPPTKRVTGRAGWDNGDEAKLRSEVLVKVNA